MPIPFRLAAGARRLTRTLAGAAFAASALAFANSPPVSTSAPPPINAWRAPTLQVQGAEQPVRLASLQVDVEVSGGAAETRVQMVFFNPNSRILEGKLQFPLAPGQVVSGFALDVDGRLRAAVPVEKARAQQVFEDIRAAPRRPRPAADDDRQQLRAAHLSAPARQDADRRAANRRAAAGRLQVPLGYADRVDSLALSLRVPGAASAPELIGAGALGLRFEAQAGGGFVARSTRRDVALPKEPIGLRVAASQNVAVATEARDGQDFFTIELPVPQRRAARPLPQRVQIVWDASGSTANRQIDRELALLDAYFRGRARHQRQPGPRRRHRRGADPLRGSRRRLDRPPTRARDDGLRRREQPRRGPPRRRLGRGALVQRRPRQLRDAVAARLPGAGVRDQQRREQRPGGAAGARRRERRPQHRPRDETRHGAADALLGAAAKSRRERARRARPRRPVAERGGRAGSSSPASSPRPTPRSRSGCAIRRARDDPRRAGARRPPSVAPRRAAVGAPDARLARRRSANEQGPHPARSASASGWRRARRR
jgi:hypothetical protein